MTDKPAARRLPEYKPAPQMHNVVAEGEINSALMADPTGTFGAIRDLMSPDEMGDERERLIVTAAWECMLNESPVATTRAHIAERLMVKGFLDEAMLAHLQKRDDQGYRYVVENAQNNARIIRQHAERRKLIKKYQSAIDNVQNDPDNYISTVGAIAEETTNIIAHADQEYDPTPNDWYKQRNTNDEVKPGAPSYLYRFNEWNLGLLPSTIIAIHGPPKDGRKTTLVANILLRPLIDGVPITWVTVDGTRDNCFDRFAAMLATYWLVAHQQEHPRYLRENGRDIDQWAIKLRGISHVLRTPAQNIAVEWARRKIYESKLRVYDVKAGIIELPRIQSYLHQNISIHARNAPHHAFVLDYVQEIEAGETEKKGGWQDSDYEKVLKRLSVATNRYGLTSFIISQPNEASLQGKGGRSSGSKGGGKLNQVVDAWIENQYDAENDPNHLTVVLKRGRYTGYAQEIYDIIPESGLITNPNAGMPYQPVEGY